MNTNLPPQVTALMNRGQPVPQNGQATGDMAQWRAQNGAQGSPNPGFNGMQTAIHQMMGGAQPQNGYTQATSYLNQYIQSLRQRQQQMQGGAPNQASQNDAQQWNAQQLGNNMMQGIGAANPSAGAQQAGGGVPQQPQPGMPYPGVPNQPQFGSPQIQPPQQPGMAVPPQQYVPPQVQALMGGGGGLSQGGRMNTQVR